MFRVNEYVNYLGCDWRIKELNEAAITIISFNGKFTKTLDRYNQQYLRKGVYYSGKSNKNANQISNRANG